MALVNLTPHAIVLQSPDGTRTTIEPSGTVARVNSLPGKLLNWPGVPVPVAQPQTWGEVEGLPEPDGNLYIVSLIVLQRCVDLHRADLLAPGTGPNDGAIRYTDGPRKGQIEAVTRLIRG